MFKDRLAAEMRAAGLTQAELAKRVGVSQGAVGFWLSGSEPRRPQYEALCAVLPGVRESDDAASAEARA